ncbi:hypothetical protein [Glutamicibacter ardleyensis]|uniref:hypothetical protein n=1 Tax=Glutamicibacter ardleyensis TaxID=225894 RepID=UPI003FD1CAAC
MFKNLKRDQLSSYSKFQVAVNTTRIEDSTLLNSGGFISVIKKGGKATLAAITVLMILMVMLVASIASAPKANAGMLEDIQNGFTRSICNNGAYGLDSVDKNFLSPKSTPKGSNPTMFEKYGFSGTSFTSWAGFESVDNTLSGYKGEGIGTSVGIISALGGNSKDSGLIDWESDLDKNTQSGLNNNRKLCSPLANTSGIGTVIGNILLELTKLIVWAGNIAFEASSNLSDSLFNTFQDPLGKIGNILWDKLFFDYLNPLIMIGALWLGWIGLVKRETTRFVQSGVWIIAVVVFAIISWGNPMKVSQTVSSWSSGISSVVASNITGGMTDGSGLCTPTGKNVAVRQFQCNNYYNNVYSPWVQGQFGKNPKQLTALKDKKAFTSYVGGKVTDVKFPMSTLKDTHGNQMNINKVFLGSAEPAEQNWALYYLDYRSNWDNASAEQKLNKNRSQMHVIAHELADPNVNRTFRGDNGGSRGFIGFIALLSAIFSNVLVVVISISIVMLDLKIMILGIFTPLYALAALHPGEGRTRAMEFLGKMMNYGLKKILLGIYLAVFVVIMNAFAGWAGGASNAGIQLLAVVAVGILGFTMKKEIVSSLSNWSLFGATGNADNDSNKKSTIAGNLWNRARAGLGAGGSTTATGLASLGNKSSAVNKVKSAIGGAGGKPQVKPGQEDNMFKKDGLKGRAPQTKKPSKDENINAQPAGETPMDNPVHDDSGSGQAPQYKRESEEQASYSEDFNRPEYENVETGYADSSGAGEAPQVGTQDNHSNEEESTPELTPQQRTKIASTKAKVQAKAIKAELKANGHRSHVGIGTVLGAAAKATVVGLATGNTSRAISAGTSTVNRKKQQIVEQNQQAIKNVSQKHRDRNYEIARQQRQSEFEKAQAKRKAEREANMKRNAETRAKRYVGNTSQQGKTSQQNPTGQAPQQKPATQEQAQKVTYQQTEPAPQQVRETPSYETPAPQVSTPANYASEVQAPRVEQPRNTTSAPQPVRETPAPQPVREARNENLRVEQPRNTPPAPQPVRETPKVEQLRVETPKYSPKVVPPKAQTPKPVIQPRKSTPAPQPVVKESKPKVSNPKSPAPPAPKAKVNPPKAQAPQPPLPSRKSLRESGNQTPPAPKPPQPRNR